MLYFFLFIAIYLLTIAIEAFWTYHDLNAKPKTIGDLLNSVDTVMFFPILNTILLFFLIVVYSIVGLYKLSKLNILIDKFLKIKL